MEIRLLERADKDAVLPLWSQAFHHGNREREPWDGWDSGSYICGVLDEQGLQCCVLMNDYTIYLGADVTVKMGGIGGVACLPASRGKGYAGACLKFCLERMHETGHITSSLFPFSWDYYRRLGWEWVGQNRKYEVKTSLLKVVPKTERVRAAVPEDRPAIQAVYTQFAKRYRGMMVRPEENWDGKLNHNEKEFTYTYVYEGDQGIEGYLTYRGGKEKDTHLREFICLNMTARLALLGLLHRMEMQVKQFNWSAPEDDTFWSQNYHWDISTNIEPVTQGRVVDVVGALQALQPSGSLAGRLHLAVQDIAAPWNTGTWAVSVEGGQVAVQRTDAPAHISLDIQALSQLYWGRPDAATLRSADRLTVHEEAGFLLLSSLLDGPPVWLNDFF